MHKTKSRLEFSHYARIYDVQCFRKARLTNDNRLFCYLQVPLLCFNTTYNMPYCTFHAQTKVKLSPTLLPESMKPWNAYVNVKDAREIRGRRRRCYLYFSYAIVIILPATLKYILPFGCFTCLGRNFHNYV